MCGIFIAFFSTGYLYTRLCHRESTTERTDTAWSQLVYGYGLKSTQLFNEFAVVGRMIDSVAAQSPSNINFATITHLHNSAPVKKTTSVLKWCEKIAASFNSTATWSCGFELNKLSCRRGTARHLKFCQLLHNCSRNRIWKGLQYVNDLECQSRLSEIALFSRLCITFCQCLYLAPSLRYYYFFKRSLFPMTLRSLSASLRRLHRRDLLDFSRRSLVSKDWGSWLGIDTFSRFHTISGARDRRKDGQRDTGP